MSGLFFVGFNSSSGLSCSFIAAVFASVELFEGIAFFLLFSSSLVASVGFSLSGLFLVGFDSSSGSFVSSVVVCLDSSSGSFMSSVAVLH